jgi:hypothetical protein
LVQSCLLAVQFCLGFLKGCPECPPILSEGNPYPFGEEEALRTSVLLVIMFIRHDRYNWP